MLQPTYDHLTASEKRRKEELDKRVPFLLRPHRCPNARVRASTVVEGIPCSDAPCALPDMLCCIPFPSSPTQPPPHPRQLSLPCDASCFHWQEKKIIEEKAKEPEIKLNSKNKAKWDSRFGEAPDAGWLSGNRYPAEKL